MLKKLFKILFLLLALLFIAVIIFIYTFDLNKYKSSIEKLASDELGAEVRVAGSLQLMLTPLLTLQADSVSIRDGNTIYVVIRSLQIDFNPDSLISLKVVPKNVNAQQVQARIACSATNSCNVTINAQELSARLLWPIQNKRLLLEAVDLKETAVRYLDKTKQDTINLDSLDLKADDLQISLRAPFKLNKILWASGQFYLPVVEYNGFTLHSLSASYTLQQAKITLKTRQDLPLLGGLTEGETKLIFKKDTVDVRLSISSKDTNTEDLLRVFNQTAFISGRITVNIDMKTRGASADELLAHLNGRLKIKGDSLSLNGMNIDALIDNFDKSQNFNLVDIGSVAMFGPMGAVVTKGTDFGALIFTDLGEQTAIPHLISDWTVKNGRARCQDVAFRTPGHIIAMRGVLDFVTFEYDDFAIAVVDEEGCAKIKQKLEGPIGGKNNPGLLKVILGPVINLFKSVFKSKCDEFYDGSLLQKSSINGQATDLEPANKK